MVLNWIEDVLKLRSECEGWWGRRGAGTSYEEHLDGLLRCDEI